MIIFLVLILLLIALFAVFIYLNTRNYYEIKQPSTTSNGNASYFVPNTDYYNLKDSWLELSVGSIGIGQTCYTNITCASGFCRYNSDTNQTKCTATSKGDGGFTDSSPYETESKGLYNYGEPYLYTAICSQKEYENSSLSYYPDFKSETLIDETLLGSNSSYNSSCQNYTFQQSPLGSIECYDADQLAGTKIVELCQATINTNQICINNQGDRVFSPSMNSLYIKPSITLCENNTSINYITFNFNNVPQTINVLDNNNISEDGKTLYQNQMMCLSTETVTYYPDISIFNYNNVYYVTFLGTWDFNYTVELHKSGMSINTTDYTFFDPINNTTNNSTTIEMQRRLQIDIDFGITYKIPPITIQKDKWKMATSKISTSLYSFDTFVDIIENTTNEITSTITLQPCAIFDTSYNNTQNADRLTDTLVGNVDRQKFKVSRYTFADGKLKADDTGIISSIIYRNLNYGNGGLYLDYYTPVTDGKAPGYLSSVKEDKLVLRKISNDNIDDINVWVLMPPMDLSPYTIPGGNNMWCNFCKDASVDGGNTFNGKSSAIVPMKSNDIEEGTELIDPVYKNLVKQPDNKLFKAVGDVVEGAAIGINMIDPGSVILTGVAIYQLTKGSSAFDFHLLKDDPSFGRCSQLCTNIVPNGVTPKVKAVALNSGTLGSVPPGHTRGITKRFAEGNVIAGVKLGGQTCQNYYLYDSDTTNQPIGTRAIGDTYVDGNVEFIIQGSYNNTYMFETNYFNNKGDIVVDTFVSAGTGYGLISPPTNVINSLTPNVKTPQKLIYSLPSSDVPSSPPECSLTDVTTTLCTIDGLTNTTICAGHGNGESILNKLIANINKQDFHINIGSKTVPIVLTFDSLVCSSLLGLETFYNLVTARIGFDLKPSSTTNTVDLTDQTVSNYFPSVTDTSVTSYDVISSETSTKGDKIYDSDGKSLQVVASYGDFKRQYRLYYQTNYVANINLISDSTGAVQTGSIDILEIVNEELLLSNIDSTFDIQEWWVLESTYMGITINIEYQHTNASGCSVKLKDSTTEWNITSAAPRDLLSISEPDSTTSGTALSFPSTSQPLNLSNNSVLKHGPSPQQIVYGGTFQSQNEYCYSTYPKTSDDVEDNCNKDPKCSFNENLGYCRGKTLLEYLSENYSDSLSSVENLFNIIKETQNSSFTNLTYLKSLQIPYLNYMTYQSMPKQTVEGGSPNYYYAPPNFINYSNQNVASQDLVGTEVKLGKFIPYEYFYPNSMSQTTNKATGADELKETSTIQDTVTINKYKTSVNNFYINLNYSQFIPYGKKSLYQNGFTKASDVPTF